MNQLIRRISRLNFHPPDLPVQATMNHLARGILIAIWVCFGAGYPLYCFIARAGLYGWLVDLELAHEGKGPYHVDPMLLAIATLIVSWIVAFALSWAALYMIGQLLPTRAASSEAPRPAPRPMAYVPSRWPRMPEWARNPVVILLVGSMVLIVVGVGAGVIAHRKYSETLTFEALNLADGTPPSSKHVKLTGLAVPSLESQYTIETRSTSLLETYIPVVPFYWRQGDPVVYFLHPVRDSFGRDSFGHTEPVMIGQTGLLMRDALPGAAVFLCKKHGITLGTPTFVLEDDAHADAGPYIAAAIFCPIIGLCVFLPIAFKSVGELLHRH